MSYIVTGGAGFIGSCIVGKLNAMGVEDIIIVDNINTTEKWLNIKNKKYLEYIHKSELWDKIDTLKDVTNIIHMGACSSTTENDFDYLYKNNFDYTKRLWNYATERQISFIYASSAATYGAGEYGFNDEREIKCLNPLNRYGYSKHFFDLWAQKQTLFPKQYVGLKFFNVYGPNEYAKGSMASVIFHGFKEIQETKKISLFKSYKEGYEDGGQLRDFVYVKDVCEVISFLIKSPEVNGLFNVGTGKAESFQTLAESVFDALDMEKNIEYIDMPEDLRPKYQYFTQASMDKLYRAGFKHQFCSLREGCFDYVTNYLKEEYKNY